MEAAKRNDLESVKATIRAFQGDALVKYQSLEDSINTAGYDFMLRANFSAAVDLYKLGLDLYPDAWTLYDSLGEVLQKAGDADGALKNYRASLTLNPRNFNAEDQIKVLEQAKVQPK